MYKLFIDDERFPPRGNGEWKIARNLAEVSIIIFREKCFPNYISFDHDLGDNMPNGFDIAKWLVELNMNSKSWDYAFSDTFDFYVHSQNPVGKSNIISYLNNYLKFKGIMK